MLKIGLTGGIGSGKTTVAKIFESLGIPIYYADFEMRCLINTHPGIKKSIIQNFGIDSYIDGELNRKYISNLVFNDSKNLELLNSITHPFLAQDVQNWFNKQITHYAIEESAIIFETGIEKNFDYIIGVTAPENIRIERVIKRDKLSKEEVLKRIDKQMNDEEKMKKCNYVIVNYGDIENLNIQIKAIHIDLLKNNKIYNI